MPFATAREDDRRLIKLALEQARLGEAEGGLPVGAVLALGGNVLSRGRNRAAQDGDPIAHAEMDCIRRAGRRSNYGELSLYTTLSPCMMCAGTILQFGIARVVVGEDQDFPGEIALLSDKGVEVVLLDDQECVDLMKDYAKQKARS
ncbi:MAG: nucleoside deaminase [Gammaproteobacteria bacterium]|nr:nucleoside deaminase [Gammaproteobacteria bacterium]